MGGYARTYAMGGYAMTYAMGGYARTYAMGGYATLQDLTVSTTYMLTIFLPILINLKTPE